MNPKESFSADESTRLAALNRYAILDTPPEAEFDDFTRLAAQICGTPIALVSLVDANRQWFKSKVGLDATETPRDIAFCSHAIAGARLFEVPDATQDERFKDNPFVTGAPNIRFYAGAPLTTPEGHNVGTLCVIDCAPRQLTPEQREALARLGRQVVARLELRLANRRLTDQAEFQQAILDNADAGIIASTPDGIITHFNPAAERMLGYSAVEMVGKLTPGVFHDPAEVAARAPGLSAELGREIAPGFEVFVAKARAGQTETREWTYVRKDGSRLPVLLSVSALLDAAGKVSGFLGIVRDLTERTRMEAQIRASEARLRDLFDCASDLIQSVAPDGRLLFTNRAWREALGYTEAETESLNLFALIDPECREHCAAIFQRLMHGEDVGTVDVVFVSKDGRRIEVEGSVNARFENGEPVSTRGIFRDVTERQRHHRTIERQRALLAEIRVVQEQFISHPDTSEAFDELLAVLLKLTGSGYGFIGEVLRTADGAPYLKTQAITNIAWNDETRRFYAEHAPKGLEFFNLKTLFGSVMTSGQPVIANSPASDPRRGGLPPGHPPMHAFLGMPIKVGEDLVGMIGMANRPGGYTDDVATEVEPLLATYGNLIVARRNQIQRQTAEAALRESEERHRLLIHGSRDAMMTHDPLTWRFNTCNPAALAMFGVATEAEFCQSGLWDISPEQQPDGCSSAAAAQARIAQAMAEGSHFFEWTLKRRDDGREFPATVLLSRLEYGGKAFLQATVRDITAQKRAEAVLRDQRAALEVMVAERTAALAESERFNTATLNALAAHVAVLDAEGVILTTNAAWRDFAEANGTAWHRVSEGVNYLGICSAATGEHAAEAHPVAAGIREVIAGGRAEFTLEYPCHSAGEPRWFLCRVTRFPGEGPVRVVLAHENITAIKQAQQRAEQTQRKFHDLFEFAPDAIVMTDATGTITLVNRQAEQLFGYARGELVGQPVELLMPESKRHDHVTQREHYLTIATPRTMGAGRSNLKGRKKDGAVFPVDISLSPMESEAGRLVVAAVRDITERVQADQQMRQALATLDATEDAAFIFDPETLRFTYVNEGAVRQLGYTREELLTLTPVDIKPQFTEAQFRALLDPLAHGEGGKHQLTTQHRRKDGHEVPVEISLKHVAPPGERPRFIAIVRDITERLAQERLAHRAQRMESIGTLAAGVAHDLNNALAPIMMCGELLRMQYPEESQMLDTVQASAKRAADMVRQLLTFAKGAEGARVSVSLKHLVKEMQGIIKSTFPKNIELETRLDQNLPTVLGDATQLHQVLLNLCVNARDAMPHGGRLTLEAEQRGVDAVYAASQPDAKPGQYLVLRVKDTGTGIPPEVLERIFEPFFTTKAPDKGTGLGLATVLGIVKGHGGFIHVCSERGKGATFAVYLPVEREGGDTDRIIKTALESRGHGETILLVDDEAPVREVGRAVLTKLGFKPLTASDGTEGVLLAAEHRTDLSAVLLDLQMPHMDGLALARALRRLRSELPIGAMSGRFAEATQAELAELGVTVQLAKPFTEAQLAEALQKLLEPKPA